MEKQIKKIIQGDYQALSGMFLKQELGKIQD